MSVSRPRRAAAATLAAVTALGLAACSGSQHKKPAATSSAPTSSSPSPTPTTSTPAAKPAPRNPYTGIGPVPRTPVVAVKIDDTAPGRPQYNIDKADIVYIEAVEAGYTRLAAIFGTNKPTVGYVRSTRPSDPDLFLQYGKITEAYSGGQRVSLELRKKAGLTGWSNDAGAAGFFRVSRAGTDYINVRLNLATVAKKTHTTRPRSIGWTFSSSLAGLTTSAATNIRTTVTGSYPVSVGTPVNFRWDTKLRKYVRYIGGVRQHAADGNAISATNVVVQQCTVTSYPKDRDVNGYPAQFTTTTGTGHVTIFRQGRRIDGTWSRPKLGSGTVFRTAAGKVIPLAPGNTWVVLIRKGVPLQG
jgi:hypothetical protein